MKDKRYESNMHYWHNREKFFGAKCQVCLGGSILANTLKVPIDKTINVDKDEDITEDLRNKLFAINYMRVGDFIEAYRILNNYCINIESEEDHILSDTPCEWNVYNPEPPLLMDAVKYLRAEGF